MNIPLTPGAAKKSLGQHFLHDAVLLRRIAKLCGPLAGRTVIEVGPGPGGLTRALLDEGPAKLIAVELDDRFAAGLRAWPEVSTGQLVVKHGDAREIDEEQLIREAGGTAPALLLANLPYNVATPLVVRWLKAGPWRGTMALMFQKEVAQRICAAPGGEHYGRLAVLAHAAMKPRIALTLPPGAFRPPPRVDSAVVVFEPLPAAEAYPDLDGLEYVAAVAFNQRRKMLRSSLKPAAQSVGATAERMLTSANIYPERRAETLSQAEFRNLTTVWRSLQGGQAAG